MVSRSSSYPLDAALIFPRSLHWSFELLTKLANNLVGFPLALSLLPFRMFDQFHQGSNQPDPIPPPPSFSSNRSSWIRVVSRIPSYHQEDPPKIHETEVPCHFWVCWSALYGNTQGWLWICMSQGLFPLMITHLWEVRNTTQIPSLHSVVGKGIAVLQYTQITFLQTQPNYTWVDKLVSIFNLKV